MIANAGWAFYKGIYRNLNENNNIDENMLSEIQNIIFKKSQIFVNYIAPYGFKLKVAYPGLLIGSGYIHGIPDDNNDTKIGFYFDYISGYPVIPGSSVKGVLRSFFEGEFLKEKQDLINKLLNKKIDIEILKNEIFKGIDKNNNPINIYKRDKFLDAYVESARDGLFAFDYITPHEEFKEPVPVKFLKVKPGVEFVFNFDLQDGIISAEEKETLFFKLIKLHGVGAKTNSGYGHFEDEEISINHNYRKLKREEIEKEKQKALEEEKRKELLQNLPPHKRVFEKYKNDISTLINNLEEIANQEKVGIIALAKLIKKELQKSPKTWEKAKQKALKRKEKIQKILKEI